MTLGDHHPISMGQGLIHGVGIMAIAKITFVEFQRRRKEARLLSRPVASHTKALINFFALLKTRRIPACNQAGMIHLTQRLNPCLDNIDVSFQSRDDPKALASLSIERLLRQRSLP